MFTAQGIVKPKRLEFDKKNKSEYYGKLSAGPFERGYGVTIGNSLRRMLLSSIEGAAIVAVKFERWFRYLVMRLAEQPVPRSYHL